MDISIKFCNDCSADIPYAPLFFNSKQLSQDEITFSIILADKVTKSKIMAIFFLAWLSS